MLLIRSQIERVLSGQRYKVRYAWASRHATEIPSGREESYATKPLHVKALESDEAVKQIHPRQAACYPARSQLPLPAQNRRFISQTSVNAFALVTLEDTVTPSQVRVLPP